MRKLVHKNLNRIGPSGESLTTANLMHFSNILLFFLGFAWPEISKGDPDFDHHRNIVPGSRAAGLGGAFTGIADDPSGAYYNPAGLVDGRDVDVSVSVNSLQTTILRFKQISALNGEDFTEESQTIFPSFAGSTYKFGFLRLGWSYVTLDAKNIDQTDRFPNLANDNNSLESYNRTHQESNTHFLAGGSAALPLGKVLSLGVSTYYYRRSIIATNHQLVQVTNGSFLAVDQKYTTLNEGILPVYGILLRFEEFSLGASYRKPMRLADTTTLYNDDVTFSNSGTSPAPKVNSSISQLKTNDEANPFTVQIGGAWRPADFFLLSSDVSYHDGTSDNKHFRGVYRLQPTFNYAAGMELTSRLAFFRCGYFTNNSQFREPKTGLINQPPHIDYVGTSASFGIINDNFVGDLTVIRQDGNGTAQKLSDDTDIQQVEGQTLTVQVGTRYGF